MSGWETPPSDLGLAPAEIHLWRIGLRPSQRDLHQRGALLSEDERARASRFRFDLHRDRFIARRGALRIILARYLRVDPGAIEFSYSPRGKPEVPQPRAAGALRFNLSDSDDLAMLGVTLDDLIGVDVEHTRPLQDMDALARDHFSQRERAEYERLAAPRRASGFYNCWTRKEAWLKARGEGIAADLTGFDVTLIPGRPPRLRSVRDDPEEASRWRLYGFRPLADYTAAVAVRRERSRLRKLEFA
jgi:4'-phosphopantetheinyl transferase